MNTKRGHSVFMNSVSDIFDAVGGPAKMALLLNVKPSASTEMKRRGSIPVWHWERLVDGCRYMGVRGVNYDTLVSLHQKQKDAAA